VHGCRLRVVTEEGRGGDSATLFTDWVERRPVIRERASGDPLQNLFDLTCVFESCFDLLSKGTAPVHLAAADDGGVHVELV